MQCITKANAKTKVETCARDRPEGKGKSMGQLAASLPGRASKVL